MRTRMSSFEFSLEWCERGLSCTSEGINKWYCLHASERITDTQTLWRTLNCTTRKQHCIYGFIIERVQHAKHRKLPLHATQTNALLHKIKPCYNICRTWDGSACRLSAMSVNIPVFLKRNEKEKTQDETKKIVEKHPTKTSTNRDACSLRFLCVLYSKHCSKQNQLNSRFPVRFHLTKFSFILRRTTGLGLPLPSRVGTCAGVCRSEIV